MCGIFKEQKQTQKTLIDTENKLVTAIHREWGMGGGEMGEGGQKVQTSRYQINKCWRCDAQHSDLVNNIVYLKVAKRINLKSSHHKKKIV